MRSNPRRARPNNGKKSAVVADYDEVVFVSERLVGIYAAQCAGWTAASLFLALQIQTHAWEPEPTPYLRHFPGSLGAAENDGGGAL